MSELMPIPDFFERVAALAPGKRHLVGIAGAPGSGKSTLAEALAAHLNTATPGRAAILAMDGYHFDDLVLNALGKRARKGAPDTFDIGGLAAMLHRLRQNREESIAVPIFDRSIEIARAGAALIPQSTEIILVEGNYVLLQEPPWSALADSFDLTALVRVSEDVLRQRLRARWEGFALSEAEIAAKLEENDLPNGRIVSNTSTKFDIALDGEGPLEPAANDAKPPVTSV